MRVEKYKSNGCANVLKENLRDSNFVASRENIDHERTCNNFIIGKKPDYEVIKNKIEEINNNPNSRNVRKDSVLMFQIAITKPDNVPVEDTQKFFQVMYKFFEEYLPNGEENLLGMTVHMDETTPHGHLSGMPIMQDKEGNDTFCYKRFFPREKYQNFHKDAMAYCEKYLGYAPDLLIDEKQEPLKRILSKCCTKPEELDQMTQAISSYIEKETHELESQKLQAELKLEKQIKKCEVVSEKLETRTNQLNYTEAELAKSNQDLKQMSNTILDMRDVVFDETVKHKDWQKETGKLQALIKKAWEFGKNRFNEITRAFERATTRDPELKKELHNRSLKLQAKDKSIQWKGNEIVASQPYQRPTQRTQNIGR